MAHIIRSMIGLFGFACLVVAPVCLAQSYPMKPVRVIFPYPGGSVPDGIGRRITQGISEILGQPFIFENRPV